jgi:hypothetical protein
MDSKAQVRLLVRDGVLTFVLPEGVSGRTSAQITDAQLARSRVLQDLLDTPGSCECPFTAATAAQWQAMCDEPEQREARPPLTLTTTDAASLWKVSNLHKVAAACCARTFLICMALVLNWMSTLPHLNEICVPDRSTEVISKSDSQLKALRKLQLRKKHEQAGPVGSAENVLEISATNYLLLKIMLQAADFLQDVDLTYDLLSALKEAKQELGQMLVRTTLGPSYSSQPVRELHACALCTFIMTLSAASPQLKQEVITESGRSGTIRDGARSGARRVILIQVCLQPCQRAIVLGLLTCFMLVCDPTTMHGRVQCGDRRPKLYAIACKTCSLSGQPTLSCRNVPLYDKLQAAGDPGVCAVAATGDV